MNSIKNKIKICPRGILSELLETQMNGLTGHIENAGFPFDRIWWGNNAEQEENENPQWWVYEQTAYWLDGFTRCAILLEDECALRRAEKIIYSVINAPDPDGYLGPQALKKTDGWNRWPHTVFFRACMALYEQNNDVKLLRALTEHYLGGSARHDKLRDITNIEIMLWLYARTGKKELLQMAEEDYISYNQSCADDNCDKVGLSSKKPYCHGVTYNEYSKLGAILYRYTGKEKYLQASESAYDKLERLFMLPGGCHCSNEFLLSDNCMESYETCDISDYTWSLMYLFDATKKGKYADLTERCIFNAGMGSVLEDFRGLQYFSCANQVIADYQSNHNYFHRGSKWMSYRPNPGTECCPGNVNRFLPNYVLNMWKKDGNAVYAVLYGASTFETDDIYIQEDTDYPFRESIAFDIQTKKPFDFMFRIPGWADKFTVVKDGADTEVQPQNGFARLQISKGCHIKIMFESSVQEHETNDGIYFSKGPLVYCYGLTGKRERDRNEKRSSETFPAYNIYANDKWNYAVKRGNKTMFVPGTQTGFDLNKDLPSIRVQAFEAPEWSLEQCNKIKVCDDLYKKTTHTESGRFLFTPSPQSVGHISDCAQTLTLRPYGAGKLRVTVFPVKP